MEIHDQVRPVRKVEIQSDDLGNTWADIFSAAADWLREHPYPEFELVEVIMFHGDSEQWDGRSLILTGSGR